MKKTAALASLALIGIAGICFWLAAEAGETLLSVPLYTTGSVSVVGSLAIGFWRRQNRRL